MTAYKPLWSLQLVRDRSVAYDSRVPVTDPTAAATIVRSIIGIAAVEHMLCLYLDQRHRLLGVLPIGQGSVDRCLVDIATIARGALLAGATAIILAHNHPSGDPMPSPEDKTLTGRVKKALEIIGIQVLDHVIVGDNAHASMRETTNWETLN